jgi:hypothetical protein
VVEIATLNDHLINECDLRNQFKYCAKCKTAVNAAEFEQHKTTPECRTLEDKKNLRCPLCNVDFAYIKGQEDKAWKKHLMQDCESNPRASM